MIRHSIGILFALLLLGACHSGHKKRFDDPVLVRTANYQDHRTADSLYHYLKSPDSSYRAAAALAFASLQDSSAATAVGSVLLDDSVIMVRRNAAFALGQTGGIASVNALIPALSDHSPVVVREVLEALGKTAKGKDIDALRKFDARDSITQEGLAWGLYRLALRRRANAGDAGIEMEFLKPNYSLKTRTAAAWFFSRSSVKSGLVGPAIINAALKDPSSEVRMASVVGLSRLSPDSAITTVQRILQSEKDYRVRVNAIRALSPFPIEKTLPLIRKALTDTSVNVAIAASELISRILKNTDPEILDDARRAGNWRVQANLYAAAYKLKPSDGLAKEIETRYNQSRNDYQKAALISALASHFQEYPFVKEAALNARQAVIKTSAVDALVKMNNLKDFPQTYKTEFAQGYQKIVEDGDPAAIGIASAALADSLLDYKGVVKDVTFLFRARDKMKMPEDAESIVSVNQAIAWLQGLPKPKAPKNGFNHPIDWTLVGSLGDSQRVDVKTSKGEIIFRLLTDEAPGSAANFAALALQHYFDGKVFHRTVPNFVIQTGCKRGDGYGGEDYTIRSEFSGRRYAEGSVGMASSGKDTEGTQWFITNSATPHLDGSYSIFGQVEKGMEVVHRLEVGDTIYSVSLQQK